jgi:hypothetical protein
MPSWPLSTNDLSRFCRSEKYPGELFDQLEMLCASSDVFFGSALSALTTSTQSSAWRW